MNLRVGAILTLIVLFLAFGVFCYHYRTGYNVDKMTEQIRDLKYEKSVLSYALSIVPEDVKNEVFYNSVKKEYPDVEDCADILPLVKLKKEEKPDEKKTEEEKPKVSMGDVLNRVIPVVPQ